MKNFNKSYSKFPQNFKPFQGKIQKNSAKDTEINQEKSMLNSKRVDNNETKFIKTIETEPNQEYNGNIDYSLYTDEVIFSSRYNTIIQSQNARKLYDSAKKGNVKSY